MSGQPHAAGTHQQRWSRFGFLHHRFWLEDVFIQKLEHIEEKLYARMRRPSFPRCLFVLVLLVASALVACTVLFLSQKVSFQKSGVFCEGRVAATVSGLSSHFYQDFMETSSNGAVFPREWEL
jgi:hypothetical protein